MLYCERSQCGTMPRCIYNSQNMTPGIYKIINQMTQKTYVGSTNNLKRRKKEHFTNIAKGEWFGESQPVSDYEFIVIQETPGMPKAERDLLEEQYTKEVPDHLRYNQKFGNRGYPIHG